MWYTDQVDGSTPHKISDNPTMAKVVGWMRRFAHGPQGKESLALRGLAEDITRDVDSGDYAGEALACYYWVCNPAHIRYRKDTLGVELVKTPVQTLKTGVGDCDDMATLLAALLMSLGHRCRFVLVSFRKGGPPTHVFCSVLLPDGTSIPLDPVANRVTRTMLGTVAERVVVDLGDVDDDYEGKEDLGYEAGANRDPAAGRRVRRVFSVWDYPTARYAYYQADAPPIPATGGFRRPRGGTPESLAALVPAGAVKVGDGARAKGTVATLGSFGDASGGLFALSPGSLGRKVAVGGGVVAAAYLGWRWWSGRKKHRRAS